MTAHLLVLLLQTVPPPAQITPVPPEPAADVDPVVVTAPGPSSVWCVRYPDRRSRSQQPSMTCQTLAEWDAVRRVRYDSRGYQEQMALRRFGVGLDTSLLEEASMGRVRTSRAARQVRQAAREAAEGRE